MKTWEVIKALTEKPYKKFVAKYFKDEYFAYTRESMHCEEETYYDAIVLETEGEVWPLVVDKFTKGLEWEEVKEPVDFMTAFKEFRKGKAISVEDGELSGGKFTYYPRTNERYVAFSEEDIANGKWYIED